MTKQEVKDGLRAAGLYNRYDNSAYWWKQAFKVWSEETGNPIDMACSRCVQEVKTWLDK